MSKNEITPRQKKLLKGIKPFLEIPFQYEIHLETKDIARAKEEVIEGVKLIQGTMTGEVGIEDDLNYKEMVSLHLSFMVVKIKKNHLEEMIKRYHHNKNLKARM